MNQQNTVLKSFFLVLFICFGLGLIIDITPAYAADADDFLITVNTENPGTSSNTEFTIPTFDTGVGSEPFASGKTLLAINSAACGALEFNGTGNTAITGAGVFANSNCEDISPQNAITFIGTGTTNIEHDVSTPGGIYLENPANVTWGSVDTNAPQVSFNQIDEPDCSGLPPRNDSGTTLLPGIYSGGISISSLSDVTLEPGLYCLDGDLSMLNGSLTGDGVTLFMRGTSTVNINGGVVHLFAPPPTNPADVWLDGSGHAWDGMLIFYSYGSARNLILNSNVDSDLVGTVYNYGGECVLNGSGASAAFNTQVVCDTVTLSGNADMTLHYDPDSQYSLAPQESYNYNVDCNDDGTYEATGVTGDYTCDYAALDGASIYTIRISDNAGDGSGFPRIYFNNGGDKEKLLSIDQWGTGKWSSMENAFEGCANMTSSAIDAPDLSNVTDMSWMFSAAASFNGAIGGWDTSNVTNMRGLFADASAFNQDISLWDVSAVTDMGWMFAYSGFNQNINNWDTLAVTDMRSMFEGAGAFNQPIGGWDTDNVTDMVAMFYDTAAFNQPIGTWETSAVTDMSWMFAEAVAFNQDISGWTTSAVTNMRGMFSDANAFNQNIGGWETGAVTDMSWMFEYASAFNQDIGGWTTTAVTDMSGMFSNADTFNQDISGWNTGAVTDMAWMFENASAFDQPIGNWTTSAVTDMSGMFTNADAFNQDISSWDVSALTDASWMFGGVALSTRNYDALLNSWGAQALNNDIVFDGGSSTYCLGEAARQQIETVYGWTITDSGKDCSIYLNDFIITAKTDAPGTSTSTQFTIPTYPGETYNYNVDCNNDGTDEITGATGSYTCDFTDLGEAGTYTIRISDNAGDGTGFPRIYFHGEGDKEKLVSIDQWGTGKWASMGSAFEGCANMTSSTVVAPDLSNVTDLSGMFSKASKFNANIGGWDISNVTDISYMFSEATIFNQDIGGWDTSNVVDMSGLFRYATAFNQNIGSWNTAKVQDMRSMFLGASSFNQDIGNWDTSNVGVMENMFNQASSFNQDIGNWNTGKVTIMYRMFRLATAFDQNLGNWDVSAVTFASDMFEDARLSTVNYDALLNGWGAQALQPSVLFDGGNSTYCLAEAARANMQTTFNWIITDGGKVCPPISFLAPVPGGSLMQPRALLSVSTSNFEAKEVQFYGYYSGSWHLLGTDANSSDGWSYVWPTYNIPDSTASVKAVAVDNIGNQATVQYDNLPLSETFNFGNGYESRGGSSAEIESTTCPVEAGTGNELTITTDLNALISTLHRISEPY